MATPAACHPLALHTMPEPQSTQVKLQHRRDPTKGNGRCFCPGKVLHSQVLDAVANARLHMTCNAEQGAHI